MQQALTAKAKLSENTFLLWTLRIPIKRTRSQSC